VTPADQLSSFGSSAPAIGSSLQIEGSHVSDIKAMVCQEKRRRAETAMVQTHVRVRGSRQAMRRNW
jgi:hypothetical protein